jgi:beta-aspartyl-peptidase (threonine type)
MSVPPIRLARISIALAALFHAPLFADTMPAQTSDAGPPIALVIHGGAGTIRREEMTPERESEYRAGLRAALDAGYAVL